MSWDTISLGDLAIFIRGVTFKPEDVQRDGLGVVRTKNVQATLDLSDIVRISPTIRVPAVKLLQLGDILVSSANSWNLVGKCAYVDNLPEPLAIGGFVAALRPNSRVSPRYLYRWFSSSRVQKVLRSFGNQTTNISNLDLNRASALAVPLPPLPEQRRIAAILDQADEIRAKRRAQLALLDELPQSLFHEMFGENRKSLLFAALVEEVRYGTSNKSSTDGIPTLRIPNIIGGVLNLAEMKNVPVTAAELARLRLRRGDLLFVRSNGNPENVGRCASFEPAVLEAQGIDPTSVIYASYLIRTRLVDSDPTFISAFMASPSGRRQLRERARTSAGQFNLNSKNLLTIQVPLTPLADQRAFATKIDAIRAERDRVARALEADNELFAALQHRAFRGEL